MKYKTKQCEIEAIEFTEDNFSEIKEFASDKVEKIGYGILIGTLEGIMTASVGDFIIKGLNGEFYPCKPDIFHKKYELLSD